MPNLLLALTDVSMDPVASPVGLAVVVIAVVVMVKAIKFVVKLGMLAVLLIGLYLVFYAGGSG